MTLGGLGAAGRGLLSAQERFESITALGRLLLNLLASLGAFELEFICERVTAGRERAHSPGKAIERPGRVG
ncbi:MAG: recombinase family protein [Clostridia bacterium]